MTRGRVSVIRDPAVAVAAAKCWMARWGGGRITQRMTGIAVDSFHPEDCGFCEYPADRLIESVEEFVSWAGLKPPESRIEEAVLRESVDMFLSLPQSEQHRLVQKAQGYLDDDDGDG